MRDLLMKFRKQVSILKFKITSPKRLKRFKLEIAGLFFQES